MRAETPAFAGRFPDPLSGVSSGDGAGRIGGGDLISGVGRTRLRHDRETSAASRPNRSAPYVQLPAVWLLSAVTGIVRWRCGSRRRRGVLVGFIARTARLVGGVRRCAPNLAARPHPAVGGGDFTAVPLRLPGHRCGPDHPGRHGFRRRDVRCQGGAMHIGLKIPYGAC